MSSFRTWFRFSLVLLLAFRGLQTEAGCRERADKVWNRVPMVELVGRAVLVPADRARAWKAYGLRPFPWKGRGLRFAHRRKGGKRRPHSACPQPFHGAPGRTGPAGLPTRFPHPRPSAGECSVFSSGPASGRDQHQQQEFLKRLLKIPPLMAAMQRISSISHNAFIACVAAPGPHRSPSGGGFGRGPPSLPLTPQRNAYWSELTEIY